MSLTKWFGEKWVDLSRPLPGGGWAECGRSSAKGPDWRKKYPKCVPLAKAKRMSPEQRRSAVARKRRAMTTARKGKPTYVSTYKKNPESGLDWLTLGVVGAAAVGLVYLMRSSNASCSSCSSQAAAAPKPLLAVRK